MKNPHKKLKFPLGQRKFLKGNNILLVIMVHTYIGMDYVDYVIYAMGYNFIYALLSWQPCKLNFHPVISHDTHNCSHKMDDVRDMSTRRTAGNRPVVGGQDAAVGLLRLLGCDTQYIQYNLLSKYPG